jgi:hypothetical protein
MVSWYGFINNVVAIAQHPANELGKATPLTRKMFLMATSNRMKIVDERMACTKGDDVTIRKVRAAADADGPLQYEPVTAAAAAAEGSIDVLD